MEYKNYECQKCNNNPYTVGQMSATSGALSKIFDVQTQKLSSVTYNNCTYTEFYKSQTSALSNVFDLFTN